MREDVIIFVGPIHISSVHHANEYFVYDMIYRGTYLGTTTSGFFIALLRGLNSKRTFGRPAILFVGLLMQ
jgi:hypothetical protein